MRIDDRGQCNEIRISPSSSAGGFANIYGNDNLLEIDAFPGDMRVEIHGSNCKISVQKLRRAGRLRITCKNGGSVSIGELTSFEDCYILADGAHVSIGRDCMISFQVSIRTTDAHGIYDLASGNMLNSPASINIEDHVWLSQGAIIAKGTHIGKNSAVGALSYLNKSLIPPHSLVVGTPGRIIRDGIIWDRRMTDNLYSDGANVDPGLFDHLGSVDKVT